MAYISLIEFEKKIVSQVDTNRPTGLNYDHIQYPNRNIDQPKSDDWVQVVIDHQDRERQAIGTGEFVFIGEVRLIVYSPVGKLQTGHYTIIDTYRQIFDSLDISFTGGNARFRESFIQTNGEANGYFSTTIVCPFTIREIN